METIIGDWAITALGFGVLVWRVQGCSSFLLVLRVLPAPLLHSDSFSQLQLLALCLPTQTQP